MKTMKVALCQLLVSSNKSVNYKTAQDAIDVACKVHSADLVVLPECWNTPYSHEFFATFAEPINGPSAVFMAEQAKKHSVYLVGGSIIEQEGDKLYNTSLVFDSNGSMIAKHRKIHLFDIDVPGKLTFKESDTLSAGNHITVFDTKFCKIGLGICYDMRFPETSRIASIQHGAKLLLFPGCFNMTTGPAHWELLQRSRALDNQVYSATCSQARDTSSSPAVSYVAWGHSTATSPWGDVIATTDEKPSLVVFDVDLDRIAEVRAQIPVMTQMRTDLYEINELH